jgi:uncharacterized protein (DUF302 family)
VKSFGIQRTLEDTSFDEALERLPAALKAEGFGVLTEIDIKSTLKEKLGVDFRRYRILGACNPPLAHQGLESNPQVGLLLPCNVAVWEDDEGRTAVAALDPAGLIGDDAGEALTSMATQVRDKLGRVVEGL